MANPSILWQGVANRDIKLENTLLDGSPRPLVKICDFGYSKVCGTNVGLADCFHRLVILQLVSGGSFLTLS